MRIIPVAEMRRLEQVCNVPLESLMQTAGDHAADEILRLAKRMLAPRHRLRYTVVAGKGNNGGDALVVAKRFRQLGIDVSVYSTCPLSTYTGTAASQASDFPPELPFSVITEQLPSTALLPGTVIIDGLLGIGAKGNARGVVAELIRQINASRLPVFSLDTPSGLDCDTGTGTPVIEATATITMAYPKRGLFLNRGPECTGSLKVVSIGIPKNLSIQEYDEVEAFTEADASALLTRRPLDSHKNSFGHALCIAGSIRYPGAPFLAAEAALRGGAGLVTLAIPQAGLMRSGPAALILSPIGDADHGSFTPEDWPQLLPLLNRANAVLYGPGIGPDIPQGFLEKLVEVNIPLVLDADGIRAVASSTDLLQKLSKRHASTLMTPHPGEMAALLKGIQAPSGLSRQEQARLCAQKCNAFILLKGHNSIVASPAGELSINTSGGPSLATAGTGDVLAGLVVSFLAQQLPPYEALRFAAFLHGYAGDLYDGASRSLIADDLLTLLPIAMKELSPWS